MNVQEAKQDLMLRTKKGSVMLYVGAVYWLLLGILSFIDMHINILGLIYLIGAGLLFPIGILVSKLLKVDFTANDNPLSNLAGIVGGMQILFSPILILIFMERVEWLPFFVATLTGTHFLPFMVLYNSKGYLFQSLGTVGWASVVGFVFMEHVFVMLPFGASAVYLIASMLIARENKMVRQSPDLM